MSISGNEAGIATGAGIGLYKGIQLVILQITTVGLDWTVILQACIISFLGGILGWLGSELMKQLKKKFINK